jgi:hypothetical protein
VAGGGAGILHPIATLHSAGVVSRRGLRFYQFWGGFETSEIFKNRSATRIQPSPRLRFLAPTKTDEAEVRKGTSGGKADTGNEDGDVSANTVFSVDSLLLD